MRRPLRAIPPTRPCTLALAAAGTLSAGVALAQPSPTTIASQAAAGSVTTTAPTITRGVRASATTKPEPPYVKMILESEPRRFASIVNAPLKFDTDGRHINAHGGGILHHAGTYYWFGEQRNPRGDRNAPSTEGVQCYESTDLYNWKNRGIVMPVDAADPDSDVARGCTIERPKVVYNARTRQFVMWMHLELKGRGYGAARAALAVADAPAGPYRFVRSLRPNAGKWPESMPEATRAPFTPAEQKAAMAGDAWRRGLAEGAYARRDFAGGQMSRDMTLFVDDDAKAYLVSSAEENYTLAIHELTDDYLDFTGRWTRVLPGGHNEAPAIVKAEGKYHMLASGCTGWAPNDARSYVADSIWGPWRAAGNPCRGRNAYNALGPDETFGGQSTFILPVAGKPGVFVAMFDLWRPRNLIDSGYIWLPLTFENGRMSIPWRDEWKPGISD